MPKDWAAKSRRMSSIAKNTPASGALNVAAMPPAAPQATSTRIRGSATWRSRPSVEPERRADLHDRALAADRTAAADAQRRRQRLHPGDLRGDPPTAARDGIHHLGHPVPARLAGEEVHQRPVQQPRDDRREDHELAAQPRQMRVGRMPGCRVVGMPGQRQREGLDQPAEHDRPAAGAGPDHQREHKQSRCSTCAARAGQRRRAPAADGHTLQQQSGLPCGRGRVSCSGGPDRWHREVHCMMQRLYYSI